MQIALLFPKYRREMTQEITWKIRWNRIKMTRQTSTFDPIKASWQEV